MMRLTFPERRPYPGVSPINSLRLCAKFCLYVPLGHGVDDRIYIPAKGVHNPTKNPCRLDSGVQIDSADESRAREPCGEVFSVIQV